MKNFSNANSDYSEDFISYIFSLSTAEIEDTIFQGDLSPESTYFETEETKKEYKLIADELMQINMQNIPPDSTPIKKDSFLKKTKS